MPGENAPPGQGDPLADLLLGALRRRPLTLAYAGLFIAHLAYTVGAEADYLSRPELHQKLGAIENAARLLVRELSDLRIFALLSDGNTRIEHALTGAARNARWLAGRAAGVRERSPPNQGRGRLYPSPAAGPDALEYCALIVSMAWHKDAETWAGTRNVTAQAICEALWRKAGGPPHTAHSGLSEAPAAFAAWRVHLIAARRYRPPHPAGKLVARIMAGPQPRRRSPPQRGRLSRFYRYPRLTAPKGDRKKAE